MTGTLDNLLAAVRSDPGNVASRLVYADSLEESGDTLAAIMQRVIAEPDDDGPRLACADELERGAGVSDGRREFAEFIRAQCELAARDDERCGCRECRPSGQHNNGPCRSPLKPLRARERELWPAVRGRFSVDGCHFVLPSSAFVVGESLTDTPIIIVRRGFPALVRCTLAEWMGEMCPICDGAEPCELCNGTDWVESPYGGIGVIRCPNYDETDEMGGSRCVGKCPNCVNGRTPGIGPRLAQAWPVERVEVTDAVIHRSGGNDTYYVGGLGVFPKEFWRALEGHRTASAARDALSAASIQWARSQVI